MTDRRSRHTVSGTVRDRFAVAASLPTSIRWSLLIFLLAVGIAPASPAAQTFVTARAATRAVVLTGFTRARTVIDLSSEEAGKVLRVFADIGQPIPASGRFAYLDPTFIDLDIDSNRAEMERVSVEIDFFERQATRYRTLLSHNSVAQMQLDEVERSLGGFRRQLDALKVRARRLAERRRRLCIAAPAGWLVVDRNIEPGEWVTVGQAVGRVGDYSRLLIPYALSLTEYDALRAVKRPTVHLPDGDRTVAARIERVAPGFDEQSHKIRIELVIDGDRLRGGLRAQLRLTVRDPEGAVLVPAQALEQRYEQHWLRSADGREIRVVLLGEEDVADGKRMARVVSPDVKPGHRFQVKPR